MYGINTIIKRGIWQPVQFQSVSRSWNEMSFYRISVLMLPTSIQRYDKKLFLIQVQNERLTKIFTGLTCNIPDTPGT